MKNSDFVKWDSIDFDDDKIKRLLNGFIKQLKKDNILVYDRHSREWNARDVYYGHMFIDYCMNRYKRKTKKIDYKKHVIYNVFVNYSERIRNLELKGVGTYNVANWYVDFIKDNIKEDIKNIGWMNYIFDDKEFQKDDLNWFDYHNLNCEYKFNNLVNDKMYPNFRFDSFYDNTKNNNNYIDEIVLEPIEIETNPRQNFGYRVYSKIKENNEKEGVIKINEIYYYRNPYDESYAAFLVKESHWDKWIKIKRNDKVAAINFKDSPYFVGKEYLKENYLENVVNHKLVNDNEPKVAERER